MKNDGLEKKKKIRKPFWIPLVVSLTIIAIAGCIITYSYILGDFNAEIGRGEIIISEEDRVEFVIERFESTTSIAERLRNLGFIRNVDIFKLMSFIDGFDGTYITGTHYLKNGLTDREIMRILSSPNETIETLPETTANSEPPSVIVFCVPVVRRTIKLFKPLVDASTMASRRFSSERSVVAISMT